MICVSIGGQSLASARSMLKKHSCVELRLDLIRPSKDALRLLVSPRRATIVTCRPGTFGDKQRLQLLVQALELGATHVDIEANAPRTMQKALLRAAHKHRAQVIFSYHNFRTMPPASALQRKIQGAFSEGADLVKVACRITNISENLALLNLLQNHRWKGRIIVVGMGPRGRIARILAPCLGSPVSYARPEKGRATAPGQLSVQELKAAWKILGVER